MASGEGLIRLIREDLSPVEIRLEQLTPRAVANLFNVNVNRIYIYIYINYLNIYFIIIFVNRLISTRCF